MTDHSIDNFFLTLGNRQRARILQLLANKGPMCVMDITRTLKAEQSAVSHGLKMLSNCHFVTVKRDGKERIYAISDTVKPLLLQIERHVEQYCMKGCRH